jgi:hypothetical protein
MNQTTTLTKPQLLELCLKAVRNPLNWQSEYESELQQQVGAVWVLLQAECQYSVTECSDVDVGISIIYDGFNAMEHGSEVTDDRETLDVAIPIKPSRSQAVETLELSKADDDEEYPRQILLNICQQAIVPAVDWRNRDTPNSQLKVGYAWAMLQLGCRYRVLRDIEDGQTITDDRTIWLEIVNPVSHESSLFYLPTPQSLENLGGRDWY